MRQEQQRVAAGAVAAQPRDDAAAARRRLDDLGREARPRGARRAIRWAASSSGPGGSGGLIDGMRIRSRRNPTSRSCAPVPGGRADRRRRRAGGGPSGTLRSAGVGGGMARMRLDDPQQEPDHHDRDRPSRSAAARSGARTRSVFWSSGSSPPAMYGSGQAALARVLVADLVVLDGIRAAGARSGRARRSRDHHAARAATVPRRTTPSAILNPHGGAVVWTGMSDRGAGDRRGADSWAATCVAGRAAAFIALADGHLVRAYRLAAVLLGSELEAQDAVQDAAVAAWARFGDLRDRARFDAWFDRILVNGCRDRLRARRRVRLVELDEAPDPPVPDGTGAAGERDALRRALAQLPADQRLAVALRYFGDRSLEEIAELTGEPLGTVKSRLHYGLQALRAAYDAAGRLPGEASR